MTGRRELREVGANGSNGDADDDASELEFELVEELVRTLVITLLLDITAIWGAVAVAQTTFPALPTTGNPSPNRVHAFPLT